MHRKYFLLALLGGSIAFGIALLWPFITVLVLGIALSVLFFPIYAWLKRKVRIPAIASFITVSIFLVILCLPLFLLASVVFEQAQGLYVWLSENGSVNVLVERVSMSLSQILPAGTVDIQAELAKATSELVSGVASIFTATISSIFALLLVILIMFYFLKDGPEWKRMVVHMSPLADESDEKIISRLRSAITGVVIGYLLVGLAQGTLMGVGLFIFGVPNAALWGVFAAIASLVPTVGTALVSIPAILFLLAMNQNVSAVGFTIWTLLIVGTIDNLLNPIIVGKKIHIHPLAVLFSVLGGIALMGAVGILIGPLIISFIYALSSVYKTEIA